MILIFIYAFRRWSAKKWPRPLFLLPIFTTLFPVSASLMYDVLRSLRLLRHMNVGDVIDGKYELVREIGRGGMGSVWEARHTHLGRKVALKFLHPQMANDQEAISRLIREAQAASSIGSDHIAEVTDIGFSGPNGAPYLVMEHLEGLTLAQLLRRDGNLEPMRAARLITQLGRALHAAHERGIVHRDIKPDNVYVTVRDDGSEYVKVLDFGIAKFRAALAGDNPALTATGVTLGTPYYMAPEQARAVHDLDGRVDVYSAGVVLYELLTGAPPFTGGSFSAVVIEAATNEPPPLNEKRPDLPAGYEEVVLKAMARDRDKRYANAANLVRALAPFAGSGARLTTHDLGTEATIAATASAPPPTTKARAVSISSEEDPEDPGDDASDESPSFPGRIPPATAVVPKSEVDAASAAVKAATAAGASEPRTSDEGGAWASPSPLGFAASAGGSARTSRPEKPFPVLWLLLGIGGLSLLAILGLGVMVCGGAILKRSQDNTEPPPPVPQTEGANGPYGAGSDLSPPRPPLPGGDGPGASAGAEHDDAPPDAARAGPHPPIKGAEPQGVQNGSSPPGAAVRSTLPSPEAIRLAQNHHDREDYEGCLKVLERADRPTPKVSVWEARCHHKLGQRPQACHKLLSCRNKRLCQIWLAKIGCDEFLRRRPRRRGKR